MYIDIHIHACSLNLTQQTFEPNWPGCKNSKCLNNAIIMAIYCNCSFSESDYSVEVFNTGG